MKGQGFAEHTGLQRLLSAGVFAVLLLVGAGAAECATWHVYPGDLIQDAIDGAGEGDTVYVHAGTYTENVIVNKRLSLVGDGADVVTVKAWSSRYDVFKVTAGWVNISGFTATGANGQKYWCAGFFLEDSSEHCNISENKCSDNACGIILRSSSNNTLTNNIASENGHGISVQSSSNNTVTNNIASENNGHGISVRSSSNNTLANNTANSNKDGIYLDWSSSNTLANNTANSNTESGIYVYNSDNNTLQENTTNSNGDYGIHLNSYYRDPKCKYNTLSGNIANGNENCGIRLYYSSNNTLVNNTANSNKYGLAMCRGNNLIYHNSFADNTEQDAGDSYHDDNTWDNGAEGNYYSDYTSTDPDGDGIGDTAYPIPGSDGSADNYPLMQPWKGCRVHNLNTSEDFLGIQAAIDDSDTDEGHTIVVDTGIYRMNVEVHKQLTLQGAGAGVVSVIAGQLSDHVFDVTAHGVNISGFTMTGAESGIGIYLNGTDHCSISNNIVSNNDYGIYLYGSCNNTLANNALSGNAHNFTVRGSSLPEYTHSVDTSNTVDGKPIYYWVDEQDRVIPSDAGYVGVVNGTNITARNLTLTKNGEGVLFAYTDHSMIENVTVNANNHGISLYFSANNTLANNTANLNEDYGIYLQHSTSNTLAQNVMNANDCGISLNFSSSNTLANNTANSNENDGIYLEDSDNNTLEKNAADSNGGHGIALYSSNDNALPNNSTSNNAYGIDLSSSNNNILSNNTVKLNNSWGITLHEASNNTLTDNTADSNKDYGIYLQDSDENTLTGNAMGSNDHGIYLSASSNNTLASNTADLNQYYGIYLNDSHDNTLQENTANGNRGNIGYNGKTCKWPGLGGSSGGSGYGYGIYLDASNNNSLTGNTANANGGTGGSGGGGSRCLSGGSGGDGYGYGIYLDASNNNALTGNTTNSNGGTGGTGAFGGHYGGDGGDGYGYGIYLDASNYNAFTNNTADSNGGTGGSGGGHVDMSGRNGDAGLAYGYGIYLYALSDGNMLCRNNLINNTSHNAYDGSTTNQWGYDGVGGNHYGDYTGTDLDGDGIGDTAYRIPGGESVDDYPLMEPWSGEDTLHITSFAPASPVNDIEGATRTFHITINQAANAIWLINGTEVYNEANVTESSYTNTSAATGFWDVLAIVHNANGTDMHRWSWNVITKESVCEGDFDNDGDVDGLDLAVFAEDFGRTDCSTGDPCGGDFDHDGDVDGSDLAVFAADFGRTDCSH